MLFNFISFDINSWKEEHQTPVDLIETKNKARNMMILIKARTLQNIRSADYKPSECSKSQSNTTPKKSMNLRTVSKSLNKVLFSCRSLATILTPITVQKVSKKIKEGPMWEGKSKPNSIVNLALIPLPQFWETSR